MTLICKNLFLTINQNFLIYVKFKKQKITKELLSLIVVLILTQEDMINFLQMLLKFCLKEKALMYTIIKIKNI